MQTNEQEPQPQQIEQAPPIVEGYPAPPIKIVHPAGVDECWVETAQ